MMMIANLIIDNYYPNCNIQLRKHAMKPRSEAVGPFFCQMISPDQGCTEHNTATLAIGD